PVPDRLADLALQAGYGFQDPPRRSVVRRFPPPAHAVPRSFGRPGDRDPSRIPALRRRGARSARGGRFTPHRRPDRPCCALLLVVLVETVQAARALFGDG